ncbi:MAG TPA: thymidine kinase [Terriglobia bacterium]|nr:thymidine kinase [Terriglobia bacterium]
MPRGELKLIIGNMFGNKTGRLILEIETLRQFGKRRVLVLKPDIDTRSGECLIRDYHGKSMEALEVPARDPWQALRLVREQEAASGARFHLIAFDEVQFFAADSSFFRVVDELLERGYGVLASGLALDFKGEPFGSTLLLFGLCRSSHDCIWLTPLCAQCGQPAALPQRLIDGKPAPYDSPQVHVGGKETYEPRCYDCRELPGRPVPPF